MRNDFFKNGKMLVGSDSGVFRCVVNQTKENTYT